MVQDTANAGAAVRLPRKAATATGTDPTERLGGRSAEVREVAVRLFYERGYHGTSLKDIGTELGLRAPSLYNHITSKQQLLQDLMFDNTLSLRGAVDAAVARERTSTERLRAATVALIRHAASHRFQVHVSMFEVPSVEEPARTQLLRLRSESGSRWRDLIREGVEAGEFSISSVDLAAKAILDLGAGVAHWFRPDGGYSEHDLAEFYGDLVLRMVGAKR